MTQADKRLEKMRRNPGNVRIEEVDAVANRLDIKKRNGGSHDIYYRDGCVMQVGIPRHKGPVREIYVRKFLELVDWEVEDGD